MATPTNLPAAFTAGQVLTSSQTNALRGAFRVLQIATTTTATQTQTTSATYANVTDLFATITPQATTSKIHINVAMFLYVTTSITEGSVKILRNGVSVYTSVLGVMNPSIGGSFSTIYLDSPNTTSAVTYQIQIARSSGTGTLYVNPSSVAASTISIMEISA